MSFRSFRNDNAVTRAIRRVNLVHSLAEKTGRPVEELLQERHEFEANARKNANNKERRSFIKAMGAGAMAAGATPAMAKIGGNTNNPGRVAVIGSGLAGMRTAHRLWHYGHQCKVYEANTRIGGRAFSTRGYFDDNMIVERGGEFINTNHSAIRNLCHQLNLKLETVYAGSAGGDEPLFFTNGNLWTEEKLNADWGYVYESFKRGEVAAPWQPTYASHNAEHVRLDNLNTNDWLDELGVGANSDFGQLMQTNVISEYGLRPEESPALNLLYLLGWNSRSSAEPITGGDEKYHVVGGNDQIIYGMLNDMPSGTVETGKALTAVTGPAMGPYTLTFEDGTVDTCDQLVMAIPFTKVREIEFSPAIWESFGFAKQECINKLTYGTNGKLHVQTANKPWLGTRNVDGHDVHMNGVAYSGADGWIVSWDTQSTSDNQRGVLCDYLGGDRGANLTSNGPFSEADAGDVNTFLTEIDEVFTGVKDAYEGKALVSNWTANPYTHGSYSSPGMGEYTSFWGSQWERDTTNKILFAGEQSSQETWGFLSGAIDSGELAAKRLVNKNA